MTFVPGSSRVGLTNPKTPAQLRAALAKLAKDLKDDKMDITDLTSDVAALLAGFRREAIAAEALVVGDVVYLSAADTLSKARANAIGTAKPEGVVTRSAASGGIAEYCPAGVVEKPGWGLTVGAEYFLSASTAGLIVTSPDSETAGSVTIMVGVALSATELLVNIQQSVLH